MGKLCKNNKLWDALSRSGVLLLSSTYNLAISMSLIHLLYVAGMCFCFMDCMFIYECFRLTYLYPVPAM